MTEAYPLQWPAGWPRTPADEKDKGWQFKERIRSDTAWQQHKPVSFPTARDKLYTELERLGASNVVVSTNHQPDKFGIPTERSRVQDHGVAIYFRLKGRSMAMACDRFDGAAANMRSLGLAIEAMRQLERHGGGQMMERAFAGFAALPPPMTTPPPKKWWEVLEVPQTATGAEVHKAFKALAFKYHPDNQDTGDNAKMAEVNAALEQFREQNAA